MAESLPHPSKAEWLTWPNAITVLRFVLILPVCWLLINAAPGNPWPVVLLAIWASTDWIDGFLARKLNQTTRTGEILDPVADRLGSVAIVLSLAIAGMASWWAIGVIALVDVLVVIIAGAAAARGDIHVTRFGKIRTAVVFAAIVILVFAATLFPMLLWLGQALLWIGAIMHVIAGFTYIRSALRIRRERRAPQA